MVSALSGEVGPTSTNTGNPTQPSQQETTQTDPHYIGGPTAQSSSDKTTSIATSASPSSIPSGPTTSRPTEASNTKTETALSSKASKGAAPSPTTGLGTNSKGISDSTIAGSIVGTAIAAGLVAAALTWLLVRRRRTRRLPEPVLRQVAKQQTKTTVGGLEPHSWEQHLPQPADDRTLTAAFSTLIDQLEVHVENHYREEQRRGVEEEDEVALLSLQSPHLPGPLPALLTHQARRPRPLMKHCLAHLVFDPDRYLPPSMAALFHIPIESSVIALPQALSRCRVLSAYVQPPLNSHPRSRERLAASITTAIDGFEAAFRPWMSRSAAPGRRQNLTAIMENAANFHLMLFSQPSSYEFDWDALPDVPEPVVLPGLVKMSDEHGSPLATVQVLVPLTVIEHL